MGFGFVEFNSQAAAKRAIISLQGKVVDGHQIELKISKVNENTLSKAAGKKEKPSTKIIVRNVPFQASRKEILQLFGSFGQLKTVRLPKKYDGGHRGFAFVEFTGAKEALNAMKALASTHLYGRHLVIEWAA
jgi:multiple RNA-binding domain-containing protein 1